MWISNPFGVYNIKRLLIIGVLAGKVLSEQTLKTSGFNTCLQNSNITVKNVDIQYDKDNQTVVFNVAGESTQVMNVTAVLSVTAYGNQIYNNTFDPCDAATFVKQLCPVPAGSFSASGSQAIPASYASLVPSIAFQIPDIAAEATLQLIAPTTGKSVACITSDVSNGKTFSVPTISYVAMGFAGAALVMSGVSALSAAAGGGTTVGTSTMSPNFAEVIGWFQGIAINGMFSVNYPPIYRAWTKNFAFSTGIISWQQLQSSIDGFRAKTGGNLTEDNVQFLQNATLSFTDGSNSDTVPTTKRAVAGLVHGFYLRDISTNVNSSTSAANDQSAFSEIQVKVSGIRAYVEQLAVPQSNTFMTVLVILGIVIAAIVVSILLLKLFLEVWALCGTFPKSLVGFRRHYWGTMARSIVQLILILYGIWVLYCVFEFTHGDSWAVKALAGVTLAVFTGILLFFTVKIWLAVKRSKEEEGDVSQLYEDKGTWIKYSLFYDCYRRYYWWVFVPVIVYMFAKGIILAVTDGHGKIQTLGQLIIESLMLVFFILARPYERRSGNIINIVIQVVRALSVGCILVFVQELGIAQTTQTITGVVLIVVQSVLTGLLAIMLVVNAFFICCKENPHRKRRKEAEKLTRDLDNLTPLDARNSLLKSPANNESVNSESKYLYRSRDAAHDHYAPSSVRTFGGRGMAPSRDIRMESAMESQEGLVDGAAPLAGIPTVPSGYRGFGY